VVRSVSCTTRAPRRGEVDGQHYYFLAREEFEKRLARDEFLEWAQVHGEYYGTLRKTVEDLLAAGRDVILTIDVQGAAQVRKLAAGDPRLSRALVTVFLMPPSLKVLEQRLKKRGTDAHESIARRLAEARREMAQWRAYDYVVVTGTIKDDHRNIRTILEAERFRSVRAQFPEVAK
jgi:guanylate kinase